MPSFGNDAAGHQPTPTFTFAGSNGPTPREEQSGTCSAAECSFTFAAGNASQESSDAEAGALGSSTDTAAASSKS